MAILRSDFWLRSAHSGAETALAACSPGSSRMMRIATMSVADLARVLDWAAEEGWNPGLDDAAAFHAADPEGFLMGWVGSEPVASIAMVRHSAAFGFIGLFMVRPDWRGRGLGSEIWRAALSDHGKRSIGLDAVAAQEARYLDAGFTVAHRTKRYAGAVVPEVWPHARRIEPGMLPDLTAFDAAISGVERPAYLSAWLTDTPTRRSLVLIDDGQIAGFGTIRTCREGCKVGPLVAPSGAEAEALLRALAATMGTRSVLIDMPENNPAARAMAEHMKWKSVFDTARMYRGAAPVADARRIFGLVTLELG